MFSHSYRRDTPRSGPPSGPEAPATPDGARSSGRATGARAGDPGISALRHPVWWFRIGLRVIRDLWVNRVLGMAAEVAFWQIVSLPPLLLALVGAVGYAGPVTGTNLLMKVQQKILSLGGKALTPQAVHQVLQPAVTQALGQGHAAITSAGILLTLWAGSTAMGDLIGTVAIAYSMRALRSPVRTRLLAVVFYVFEVIVGSAVLLLATIGPGTLIGLLAPFGGTTATIVHALYWPFLVVVSLLILVTFYHLALPVRSPWLRELPGAVLAMLMAAVSTYLLRRYLTGTFSAASAFAGLGAIIAVLLFLYLLALSVLVGASVNGQIDKQFPSAATRHVRRPELHPEEHAEALRRGELSEDWRSVTRTAGRIAHVGRKLRKRVIKLK
jgi:membrane protein